MISAGHCLDDKKTDKEGTEHPDIPSERPGDPGADAGEQCAIGSIDWHMRVSTHISGFLCGTAPLLLVQPLPLLLLQAGFHRKFVA